MTKLANGLKELGVGKGTPVGIYLGMVPEAPIAMLACARLGAPHTVVFGGFSADSLSGRLQDMGCEVLITQDEAWRRGTTVPLKRTADEAVAASPTVKSVVVLQPHGQRRADDSGARPLVARSSRSTGRFVRPSRWIREDLLYLLYTSGTTAKPKGIVHTTAGYLVGVATTHHYIFDLKRETDVYWCAADVGWVTGHSYIVYGPLCNGATSVMYEGTPDFPDKDRWWDIVERYGVTILYTAPTAIRSHMKWGPEHAANHDLSTLRLLGSVGEPINPEAWVWYHEHIGGERCPIVDTWWQTETGMILITPLPGITTTKPGAVSASRSPASTRRSTTRPARRSGRAAVATSCCAGRGRRCSAVSTRSTTATSTPTGRATEDVYFAGDGARIDEDGDFWLLGRVDDVMNVSGHRISTIEVESALVDHHDVAEAAVAARNDATTGQAIVAFVTLKSGVEPSVAKLDELREPTTSRRRSGRSQSPPTSSSRPSCRRPAAGKIMRRLLRDVAENRPLGDTTTLADPTVVAELQSRGADEQSKED